MLDFFKNRILAWFGILGLSVSIVGTLEPVIQLADFVHFVVEHWHDLTRLLWNSIIGLFGLKADAAVLALLNAGIFCFSLELASFGGEYKISIWSIFLKLFNGIAVAALWLMISILTLTHAKEPLVKLPDPFSIDNWLDRKNWFPLGVWAFASMQITIGFSGNPYLLARRLINIAILCVIIAAFNFVSIYAPIVREWIANLIV